MLDSKFYTKHGRLTRYALACGYVERVATPANMDDFKSVTLIMEGSVIQVFVYERRTGRRSQFSTQSIAEARRVFSSQLKEFGLNFVPTKANKGSFH